VLTQRSRRSQVSAVSRQADVLPRSGEQVSYVREITPLAAMCSSCEPRSTFTQLVPDVNRSATARRHTRADGNLLLHAPQLGLLLPLERQLRGVAPFPST
jgi:hypothetical protein